MLRIGSIHERNCQGVGRRELLRAGAVGAIGLSLPQWLRLRAAGAVAPARARSVIFLWLWGGPSHIDTLDMKPGAPVEYRGPYRPVATSVPGVEICELLPQLARRAECYAILRSLHHGSNDHGIAGTIGLTGSDSGAISLSGQVLPGQVQPAHGAVVGRVKGRGAVPQPSEEASPGASTPRPLPGFVSLGGFLHQGKRRIEGEGGGVLGTPYDPFRLDYDPETGVKIPQLELLDGVTPDLLASRRDLLGALDRLARRAEESPVMGQLDEFYQQAFSLLTSGRARRVFDLAAEPDAVRQRYGRFRFGQCCLLARRLVEAGVPFVQVNWSSHVEPFEDSGDGGWDTHDRNFPQLQDRHCWMLDQSLSALLDDLAERGLLDETIVVAVGEFGRTPKINAKAGRDHWHHCYSGLIAGGGVRGGQVLGASDRRAEYPATRPVEPKHLAATVYRCLGITTPDLTGIGLTSTAGDPIEELV